MTITRMTGAQARKYLDKNNERIQEAYDKATPVALEGDEGKPVKRVARGFAKFKQYINRAGRPKSQSRKMKVSVMLPEATVISLRGVAGYSTMLGEYIMDGISQGKIRAPGLESANKV